MKGCGNITKISLDMDDELLKDLKKQASINESNYLDLIVGYIQQGLKESDNMVSVTLNENVVEKVNIMAKLTKRNFEEVVNDVLWENLEKIVDIPEELDYDKIWNMLEHDKPEGDDILDNLARFGEENWD